MREFHSDIEYKQLSPWISKYYASRMSIDSLISINGSDLDPYGLSNIVENLKATGLPENELLRCADRM